jgi:hypothetical protein
MGGSLRLEKQRERGSSPLSPSSNNHGAAGIEVVGVSGKARRVTIGFAGTATSGSGNGNGGVGASSGPLKPRPSMGYR